MKIVNGGGTGWLKLFFCLGKTLADFLYQKDFHKEISDYTLFTLPLTGVH
jgi:hypothetical protein